MGDFIAVGKLTMPKRNLILIAVILALAAGAVWLMQQWPVRENQPHRGRFDRISEAIEKIVGE